MADTDTNTESGSNSASGFDSRTDPGTAAHRIGGKAAGLELLQRAGVRVPAWVAVDVDWARDHWARAEANAVEGEARIERLVNTAPSAPLREHIINLLTELDSDVVSVRSSGISEDSASQSLAGAFDSVLDVPVPRSPAGVDPEPVLAAIRQVWASAVHARTQSAEANAPIAVVLQQMITAKASGVAFTTADTSAFAVVSAAPGPGENVVAGLVDTDTYVIDAAGRRIAERRAGAGHVLDDAVLAQLAHDLGAITAAHPAAAVDVEFCCDEHGLWLLQCRPVTAHLPVPQLDAPLRDEDVIIAQCPDPGQRLLWDNSNIIESFNGPTSPLTFTTAANVYRHVYDGYAASLAVPAAQRAQVAQWTPQLLGYFHGRVYYNLLHWYRMVGIAPGYPLNRRVLEVALGVGEPLDTAIARTIRPFDFPTPLHRAVSRARTTALYIRRVLTLDKFVDEFLTEFEQIYAEFDAHDYDALSGTQILAHFERMETALLRRWGPVMVLDAALLTLSGLLFGLTKALLPHAPEWFSYAVIAPGEDIESAEPTHALRAMAARVAPGSELEQRILHGNPEETWEWITTAGPADFAASCRDYIARYGYRSLDELKLEAPDLREHPALLVVFLRSAVAGSAPQQSGDADAYIAAHLRGWRRHVYDALRRRTSRGAAARERLRFARTRAFGMVKRMIRAMGRDLQRRGAIDSFDDVFFLHLDELREVFDSATPNLRQRIASRRVAMSEAEAVTAPARFWTTANDHKPQQLVDLGFVAESAVTRAQVGDVLHGTASAAGTATGEVVIVKRAEDIREGILVGYRTDPGWAAALPAAKALLIERGSPLTHVAIIARELGIPTVVQIDGLTGALGDGMRVHVDATAGTVHVLADDSIEE